MQKIKINLNLKLTFYADSLLFNVRLKIVANT